MKSKIAIIVLTVLIVVFLATTAILGIVYLKSPHCDNGKSFVSGDKTTWIDQTPNLFTLPTEKDIAKIEEGMLFEDVVKILGKPQSFRNSETESYILRWDVFGGGNFYLHAKPKKWQPGEKKDQYVVSFVPEDYNK